MQSSQWAFKLVRRARGMNGEFFDHPNTKTFTTEQGAREFAEGFARMLRGTSGTYIAIRHRGGRPLCEYHVTDDEPRRVEAMGV